MTNNSRIFSGPIPSTGPALHCIALHCIALHCDTLHCTVLYCTVLPCIVLYCPALYCSDRSTVQCVGLGPVLPDLEGESNSMCVCMCVRMCMYVYTCMHMCTLVCTGQSIRTDYQHAM